MLLSVPGSPQKKVMRRRGSQRGLKSYSPEIFRTSRAKPSEKIRTQVLLHHRGVLVGRAVLDGCGVDFSGNGGHFFGLGTARQRLPELRILPRLMLRARHSRGQV
jgi:hypothetical protein